jgi:hypothetical protein
MENQIPSEGGGGFLMLVYLVVIILVIAGLWKTFSKAGQPGWASIIPFFNLYVLCVIGGKPGWWLILFFIPVVNIVIALLVSLAVAENFGKGAGFGIGLWLLGFIFYPILGFGSATYTASGPTLPAEA